MELTWQQAEHLVWAWMRINGYPDATLTPAGPDGGVDVRASRAVAQVKHHARPAGIAEIQRLAGIAGSERRDALLFSSRGVTPAALTWATAHGVTCFSYEPVRCLNS